MPKHSACIPANGTVLPDKKRIEVRREIIKLTTVKITKLKGEKQMARTMKNRTSPNPK